MDTLKTHLPGTIVCLLLSGLAFLISQTLNSPVTPLALLLGLVFHRLYFKPHFAIGIDFCAKEILRVAVALLGLRIAFDDITQIGIIPVITTCATCILTLMLGIRLGKFLKQSESFSAMSAIGVSICGASAILAMAAILPHTKHIENKSVRVIIIMTAFSTIAMVLYPYISHLLDLSPLQAGIFIGSSIHDVSQVVGAGYAYDAFAGEVAVFIKMIRVSLLAPIILFFAYRYHDTYSFAGGKKTPIVPLFLVGFIFFIIITYLEVLPIYISDGLISISSVMIAMAIAAIGLKVSFNSIIEAGTRPIRLILYCTLFIGLTNLFLVYWLV